MGRCVLYRLCRAHARVPHPGLDRQSRAKSLQKREDLRRKAIRELRGREARWRAPLDGRPPWPLVQASPLLQARREISAVLSRPWAIQYLSLDRGGCDDQATATCKIHEGSSVSGQLNVSRFRARGDARAFPPHLAESP